MATNTNVKGSTSQWTVTRSTTSSPTSAVIDQEVEKVMHLTTSSILNDMHRNLNDFKKSSAAAMLTPRQIKSVCASKTTSIETISTMTTTATLSSLMSSNSSGRHRRHSAAAVASNSARRSKSALISNNDTRLINNLDSSGVSYGSSVNTGRRSEGVCGGNRLPPIAVATDGVRKSAFSPYKPTTVLTNLQRGNIETQTPSFIPDPSLHQLAAQGELELAQVHDDSRLNEQDEDGLTPLMWAASYGQVPTVNLLLSHGANPHIQNERNENALLLASSNGHIDIARILLERGVDIDHTDQHGNTALMYAAFNNHACCAQELIQHQADISRENHYGDTAFCIAVARSSKQVQIILERHLLNLLDNI